MRSDVKGFAFGLSLGLVALAAFGAANLQGQHATGTFQISAAPSSGGNTHCYLVDTSTGEVTVFRNGAWETISKQAP